MKVVNNAPSQELSQHFVNCISENDMEEMSANNRYDRPAKMEVELSGEVAVKVLYGQEAIDKMLEVDWVLLMSRITGTNDGIGETSISKVFNRLLVNRSGYLLAFDSRIIH